MCEENLARFRQATEAFNRGDMQAWLEFFDPDCVFEPQVAVVEGAFTGHDGVRAFGQTIREIFDIFQVDFDEVRDLGDDRVLALGSAISVGKGSGIEQRAALAILVQFRNGQLVRFTDFGDQKQALEAAGLSG
jgi:ketosteroid isomerase-like protein